MYWLTVAQAVILFLAGAAFLARPNPLVQLVFMLAILLQLVMWPAMAVVALLPHNKAKRLKLASSLGFVPLALVASVLLGRPLNDYLFYRDLTRMKEVVTGIEKGSIRITNASVPIGYENLAYRIDSSREGQVLTVTFWIGSGFPVKHNAYIYRSDGKLTPEMRRDWPSSRQREEQWFQVSD